MTDEISLIRHGSKTDFDLYAAYEKAGMDPSPAIYNVTEEVWWRPVPEGAEGISLAQYGVYGTWLMGNANEPLASTIGVAQPIDFYHLPLVEGATVFDEPHTRADGEV